ncbi:MAG: acetylglutamate kinase [Candidatus Omnitrophica bacterium]|jgi:acetylglutamate kinase|nr:acetylglutamate kinase [Candidatus Omnitrophota bacterium]
MKEAIRKAEVLIEALPYIQKFQGKIFIIKYGGSILSEERVRKGVLEDIAFLRLAGIMPIIVHGGGPNITNELKKHNIVTKFVKGMRVTDAATLKIVEKELDELNDMIVKEIELHGVKACGFKSKNNILKAEKKESEVDLGFVGQIIGFDKEKLLGALDDAIPVICPIGRSVKDKGISYNINADDVAFFLASSLKIEKLVFLTNVLGIMRNHHDSSSLISSITAKEIEELIEQKVIDEGMLPKARAAAAAIKSGVGKAHIVDAKISHAILLEIFTDKGISTEIVQ